MAPFQKTLSLVLRLIVAVIMLQTLWSKFSASPESVYIFSALGIEPWGRILTGVAELILSITLFVPRLRIYAMIGTVGIMAGAMLSHLLSIGIEIMNDSGYLFSLASITFVSASILCVFYRKEFTIHPFKKSQV